MPGRSPAGSCARVRAATYHQVRWPAHDTPVYATSLPRWSPAVGGYVDPETGVVVASWDEALDGLDGDPEAEPAHVLRFGDQDDLQGLMAGTAGADRAIGYLCKYLPKAIAGFGGVRGVGQ